MIVQRDPRAVVFNGQSGEIGIWNQVPLSLDGTATIGKNVEMFWACMDRPRVGVFANGVAIFQRAFKSGRRIKSPGMSHNPDES